MSSAPKRAWRVLRDEGPAALVDRLWNRMASGRGATLEPREIRMLVRYDDARDVDWTTPARFTAMPREVGSGPWTTAWVMSPPGESSGGHQNLFRFIRFLEDAGHDATVYLYHSHPHPIDADYLRRMVRRSPSYPDVRAPFVEYRADAGVASDTDAIFATGWETSYPAYRDLSTARRFYFVQDFEPAFYPVGSEYVFAENTYRFGFTGITAGPWLANRLSQVYGMVTYPFDFGADLEQYGHINHGRRSDVFFYARPVTTRRGFELGVMALQHLARLRPDVTIHLAGWDVSDYDLPFRHVPHGAMDVGDLKELYNECAVALVISLTNLSLLPLELLACGVIPVLNSGSNNSSVVDSQYFQYADPTPLALAHKIIEVLDWPDLEERSAEGARSAHNWSWQESGRQFLTAFEGVMRG